MLLFMVAQGLYLSRYMEDDAPTPGAQPDVRARPG